MKTRIAKKIVKQAAQGDAATCHYKPGTIAVAKQRIEARQKRKKKK